MNAPLPLLDFIAAIHGLARPFPPLTLCFFVSRALHRFGPGGGGSGVVRMEVGLEAENSGSDG